MGIRINQGVPVGSKSEARKCLVRPGWPHLMGLLEEFFRKVHYSWDVGYCLGYIFSLIKIFTPHSWEMISGSDRLHLDNPTLLFAAWWQLGHH